MMRSLSLLDWPIIRSGNWRPIARITVILGLLLVAPLLGIISVSNRVDPALLGAGVLATVIVAAGLRWPPSPELALESVLLAAGLTNFLTIPTGTQSRIVVSLLIASLLVGGWLVSPILHKRKLRLRPSAINRPVMAFVVVNIVAFVWAGLMRDPLIWTPNSWYIIQGAALTVNVLLPLLALYVANTVTEVRWLRIYTWTTIVLGIVVVVSELLHLPISQLYFNGSRGLFAMWVVVLAFALALTDRTLSKWVRAVLLVVVGAWIFKNFLLNALWLSGWVPVVVASGLVIWFRSKKLAVLALLLLLIYIAWNAGPLYQRIFVANAEEGSLSRLDIWQMSLTHVANHPLFGMGPAGYAVYNMTYHPQDARSTHNNFFDVLAQTGVVGFTVFIWLFAAFAYAGNRVRRVLAGRQNFEEAFAIATLSGCFGALIGMMLGDWVLPFAYNQTISGFDNALFTWFMLGAMIALSALVQQPTVTLRQTENTEAA